MPYLPGESDTGMFGGNSNWRGPIWMPVNALIIRALLQYYAYYGNEFTVECPTGSGRQMNLYQIAEEISGRLASIFLKGKDGRRPVYGGEQKFQEDPHWRDYLQFYEYFHGDNWCRPGCEPPDRAGPASSPARCIFLRPPPRSRCSNSARPPPLSRSSSRQRVDANQNRTRAHEMNISASANHDRSFSALSAESPPTTAVAPVRPPE